MPGAAIVTGESFLLLLGDTVYASTEKTNCTRQLTEIYETLEKPLVAIHKIPFEQIKHYGVLSGNWLDDSCRQMTITVLKEKPEASYAENNLNMSRECYAVFCQQIFFMF